MSKFDKSGNKKINLGRRIALVVLMGWVVFSGIRTISAIAYLQTMLTEHDVQEIAISKLPEGSYGWVNGRYQLKAIQTELQSAKFDVGRETILFFIVPLLGLGIYYAFRLFAATEDDEDENYTPVSRQSRDISDEDDFAADISGRPIGVGPRQQEVAD